MEPQRLELTVSAKTLFKIFLAVLMIAIAIRMAPLFMLLFMALLLAVTLYPILRFIQKRGAPRWLGILAIILGLVAFVALFFVVLLPSMVDQITAFIKNWPRLRHDVLEQLGSNSLLHPLAERLMRGEELTGGTTTPWMTRFLSAGQYLASGIFELFVVLILSVYFVLDGPRTFQWCLAFFEVRHRKKIRDTGNEVSEVIFAYVAGQVITSALVFVYTLVLLRLLHVPAALTLAAIAGIFDVLPVLGFFISAGPAVLLALTVSPSTALIVLGLYFFYHGLETYFVVPKVYGNRLRLSTLSVLVSLLAADLLAGIAGAIVVLPLIASYSIIERIWLTPFLGESTIEKHTEQSEAEEKK